MLSIAHFYKLEHPCLGLRGTVNHWKLYINFDKNVCMLFFYPAGKIGVLYLFLKGDSRPYCLNSIVSRMKPKGLGDL